jgi:guanylate kinase
MQKGRLFVVSGPSGAGKGTLVKELMRRYPHLRLSISATTRKPRPGEQEGREYFFLSEEEFQRCVAEGAFLEWAEVYGNRYGTFAEQVERELRAGYDLVLEIDVQGALQVKGKMPEAVTVFIQPPSLSELEERLRGRRTDKEEEIKKRLQKAEWEMEKGRHSFDYRIVNDRLEDAADRLAEIYERESPSTKKLR